jgi:hypothetical protein
MVNTWGAFYRPGLVHPPPVPLYHGALAGRNLTDPGRDSIEGGTAPVVSFRVKGLLVFAWLTLCLAGVWGESVDLNLHLQGLEEAAPPQVYADAIVLTYQSARPVFIVGARFSHEQYRIFHTFRKNENNLFVLSLPLPETSAVVKYRLMVDGVWLPDPANPAIDRDEQGTVFSLFTYEKTGNTPLESPRLLTEGFVEFSLETQPGLIVTIAGDFNGYDPFTHRLKEIRTGIYSTRLKLLSGRHLYYYIVNGVPSVDPRNERMVLDADHRRLSLVIVP